MMKLTANERFVFKACVQQAKVRRGEVPGTIEKTETHLEFFVKKGFVGKKIYDKCKKVLKRRKDVK